MQTNVFEFLERVTVCQKHKKSILYTRCFTEACNKRRGPEPGQHISKEASQWWQAVDDSVSDLTGPWIEPQTSSSSIVMSSTSTFTSPHINIYTPHISVESINAKRHYVLVFVFKLSMTSSFLLRNKPETSNTESMREFISPTSEIVELNLAIISFFVWTKNFLKSSKKSLLSNFMSYSDLALTYCMRFIHMQSGFPMN